MFIIINVRAGFRILEHFILRREKLLFARREFARAESRPIEHVKDFRLPELFGALLWPVWVQIERRLWSRASYMSAAASYRYGCACVFDTICVYTRV